MITIGRLVYKASGIMSKKGIVKNSEKIGRKLADEIKTGEGKVKIDRIFELLERTIGKKKASNIIMMILKPSEILPEKIVKCQMTL